MSSKPRFVGEKVKLGSCFSYIKNGYNVKQGKDKGGIPITRIETLSDDRFNRNKVGYADIFSTKGLENRVLEDGDILMSHINSLPYLGRSVMYRARPDEVFIHGMNLLRLKADRSIVEPAYAELYFRTPHFKQQILKIAKKAVNQASISVSNLKELDFPLMSLHDQHVVIERLSLIITQMEQCERTTKRLDSLVKSQFVEMFGDPSLPDGRWRVARLDSFTHVITGNTPSRKKPEYYGEGIEWVKTDNIANSFVSTAAEQLTAAGQEKARVAPAGSILMTCIAGSVKSIGKVGLLNREVAFNQQINAIVPEEDVNSKFLLVLLTLSKNYLCSSVNMQLKGILNKSSLSAKEFPLPPLELQQGFAAFVSQVDKSRFIAQQQIEKLQMLYDSLAQDYFGD